MMSQGQHSHSSQLINGILHPQANMYVPAPTIHPATGFQFRQLSHHQSSAPGSSSRPAQRFRVSLSTKPPGRSTVRAPFAERKKILNDRGPSRNPVKKGSFPRYSSLNDPHLLRFYARKFGFELIPPLTKSVSHQKYALCRSYGSSWSGKGSNKEAKNLFKVKVKTGDKRNAGTNAKVFLRVNGSKGKINKQRLFEVSGSEKSTQTSTFHFSPGSSHTFDVYGPNIGDIKSITLEHDGILEKQAWFVEEVSVTSVAKGKTWHFTCQRWLSLFHTDCQLGRTFNPVSISDFQLLSSTHTKNTDYMKIDLWGSIKLNSERRHLYNVVQTNQDIQCPFCLIPHLSLHIKGPLEMFRPAQFFEPDSDIMFCLLFLQSCPTRMSQNQTE